MKERLSSFILRAPKAEMVPAADAAGVGRLIADPRTLVSGAFVIGRNGHLASLVRLVTFVKRFDGPLMVGADEHDGAAGCHERRYFPRTPTHFLSAAAHIAMCEPFLPSAQPRPPSNLDNHSSPSQ
jgi:hypothetical protein